jgi:predicted amidohydrolase
MDTWTIAGVQMDCRLGDTAGNLAAVRARLADAAGHGARLVVFPECVLTGYCFDSKDEAWPHAQPLPGPATDALADDCRRLGVWAVVGLLERDEPTGRLFNACALVGPGGLAATYRKIHLPFLGVDRFTTPGDRPFAVHDLGGLRVGMIICFDGGFPESARILTVLGADLIVLPTNWPPRAIVTVRHLVPARAIENRVFFLAVNRVGSEGGFEFIGHSRLLDCTGELLAASEDAQPTTLIATIDPARARDKQIVGIPGKYELNLLGDRRPDLYGPLLDPPTVRNPRRE